MSDNIRKRLAALENVESMRAIERMKRANSELKRTINAYLKEIERLDAEKSVLLALDDERARKKWEAPAKVTKGQSAGVILLSDWHIEETVHSGEVCGVNRWTLADVRKCIPALFARIPGLLDRYRVLAKIDELVVCLMGDFITGHLRPEQIYRNSLSPIRAIQLAEEMVYDGLMYLIENTGVSKISIVTVTGNHGRTTDKLWASGRNDTSYETLMYEHLRKKLMDDNRFTFNIGEGEFNFVDIYDWRARVVHGDCFTYRDGQGGLSIPVNKLVNRWDSSRKMRADMTFFGHHHNYQYCAPNRWVCNGALPGIGPYSMRFGDNEPCQALAIVDKVRGLTDSTKIFGR